MKAKPHEQAVARPVGASNPGKLANDLNSYNKKNNLGFKGLSPEEVGEWLEKLRNTQ
jgi:hypothetical protein